MPNRATMLPLTVAALVGILSLDIPAQGQKKATAAGNEEFLTASVKPSRTYVQIVAPVPLGRAIFSGERMTIRRITVRDLVRLAYVRPLPFHVQGGPPWIDSRHFDIEATLPPGARNADHPPMLRALLRDRFKLAATVGMKEMSAEALVMRHPDKRLGPRLRRSNTDCSSDPATTGGAKRAKPTPCGVVTSRWRSRPNGRTSSEWVAPSAFDMQARSVGMPTLAEALARTLRTPVVDQTRLMGLFDLDLEFQRGEVSEDEAGDATRLKGALGDQLGLTLRRTRAAVEVLVIDRAELPTPDAAYGR